MQNAVKASNFQIPLQQLGKLFAFAQQRARETGESVDYLVDSIVLGIGRKSPLILDNLGISAIRLREEFKGLGVESAEVGDVAAAVGKIIDEEMGKAGETMATTADRMAAVNASFKNFQADIGKDLLPLMDILIGALQDVGQAAVFVQDKMFDFFAFLGSQKAKQKLANDEQLEFYDSLVQQGLGADELQKKLKALNAERDLQNRVLREYRSLEDKAGIAEIGEKLNVNRNQIAAVNTLIAQLTSELSGGGEGGDGKGLNKSLEELKYDFDALYPPVDAITKAMEAFGQQFAFIRSQITEGIDVGLDLDRTAEAILNVEKSLQQLKDTNSEYVDTTQEAADWTQAWFDISSSAYQGLSAISDQQTQKYIDNLQAQFDAGQITQEQFDRLQDERLRKNARQQKSAAIFDIILSTAQAIMNALTLNLHPLLFLHPLQQAWQVLFS
jgi:hypothetical protein